MAFAKAQLLLTSDRETQLTAALANSTVTDPLTKICTEAETVVLLELSGYTVDSDITDTLTRAVALYTAYSLAEGPIPGDIKALYDSAMKLLEKVKALSTPTATTTNLGGAWGSGTKLAMRTESAT